jgi:RHS repeat-associated protein
MNSSGNNQFSTSSGFSYDAAGNTLGDGLYTYAYDAEGHQKSAAGVNYIYDGDGQRVEKANGTIYWYGTGGEVLTESALDGSSPVDYIYFGGRRLARVTSSAVYYYFGDHLDSARVMVQAGANTACYEGDFEPYGREHVVTGTCSQHYKFTGKERDTETQNDYFPARFLESNLARWLGPDPGGVNAVHLEDPQTWNMYAYVRNNPATLNDPTGLGGDNKLGTKYSEIASCKKEPGMCMRGTDTPGPQLPPAQSPDPNLPVNYKFIMVVINDTGGNSKDLSRTNTRDVDYSLHTAPDSKNPTGKPVVGDDVVISEHLTGKYFSATSQKDSVFYDAIGPQMVRGHADEATDRYFTVKIGGKELGVIPILDKSGTHVVDHIVVQFRNDRVMLNGTYKRTDVP